MNQKRMARMTQIVLAALLAVTVVVCAVAAPTVQASGYEASFIREMEGLKVDYTDYLNTEVVHQLPEGVDKDEEISVIITLDTPNLMDLYQQTDRTMSFTDFACDGAVYGPVARKVNDRMLQIVERLEKRQITCTTGEVYHTLLSGFELLIRAEDYQATCKALKKGETAILGEEYKVAETKLVENTVNVYDTGIFKSEGSGYDGSGMVVAVLDTGLDSKHSAFSVDNFTSEQLGLTYEQVAKALSKTKAYEQYGNLGVDDVYINEKVPFGFDYADCDPDVYSTHNNHGTHVSGVITGKDDTIIGVAPNAQLCSMKVFSDVMDTARSTWILSALEDCVTLGVDVINMSLGTACGFAHENEEELLNGVYDKIRQAGISLVVAASNSYSSAYGSEKNGNLGLTSNPDTGTVGSPGTYDGALSVASISGKETPYILYNETIIYFDEANNGASEPLDFVQTLLGDVESMEYEYITIPGVGRSADYTGLDVKGKVVLVRRGDNTFEEKAMIAEAQGAAGIIVYNNVSGEIKMNVGDAALAVCSISQDDGELLAQAGTGKLSFSKKQSSGPFISDFSSWGPTPSLQIKPEITAHGGEILSSITGGGYDRLSGTSMACPNLAGVVILLRQYVVENFPEIAEDNVQVNAMVNRLMMSTADIALNTNGLPYAVRKQGAGLANLLASIQTDAYITTYDKDGKPMDKTKLELGDDVEKNGVYEMQFSVTNFGGETLTYDVGAHVLTEGVSETKTSAGETTVTEEAYLLDGAQVILHCDDSEGGHIQKNKLTVFAGDTLDVSVTIILTEENKAYLNESFENGMYVEGYITLTASKGTEIDLNVPYLAFYGDWTAAPLFDLDYFETDADERDDSIAPEDKNLPDAYSSRPIGGLYDDYVSYLGSYYFQQNPEDMIISANRDYIALSNQEGTVHSLRFVWAGLLRNASRVEISITDDTTGEVIFETVDEMVRKSYGDGGSIYPANIEIEFDTMDYNLSNNTEYTVQIVGYLDYGNGALETNEKNTFTFPLVVDFEAPVVSDVEFYYEYDKTMKKNRLYAKVGIYDNHFAMAAQFGYVGLTVDQEGNSTPELFGFEQYMAPVYSKADSTTYVTFELTDHVYTIKENAVNGPSFVVTCYDYAMNFASYEIGLPDSYTDFYFDSLEEGITLSPNEVFSLEPLVMPDTGWSELLEFTSSRNSVVRVVNNKLVAAGPGKANVKVRDPETNQSIVFTVTVLKEGDEGYRRYDKPVADIFSLTGYVTNKAYYIIDNNDKLIGDTGDKRFFEGAYSLTMYPSESVTLTYDLDAYFPNDTKVVFESSNESIVTIDENGRIVAQAEGFASVTMKVLMDDKSTYYSESVSVEVQDPYITTGPSLTHYFGKGGTVTIPERLHLTDIGNFAFANFDYILKTDEELAFDDSETSKQWYIGENTITKVILPEGVEKIGAYAFANLTALEEIVLPSTLEAIDYGAFFGCSSLEKISFSGENNLKIINKNAFESCNLQGTIDLSSVCVISDYAFAGNDELKGVTTADALLSIGQYAFAGCKKLETVTISAAKVKYGPYAFTDCESLKEFTVNAAVVPEGMFFQCEKLEKVTIGAQVNAIGEFAFRETALKSFTVEQGNTTYQPTTGAYILSADGKTLMAVSATMKGTLSSKELDGAQVTAIGDGALSHNSGLTAVRLPSVTVVGNYAFGSAKKLESFELGQLTSVGEYAFFETALAQLPQITGQTAIGQYAFAFTALEQVILPDGIEIGEGAFSECASLTSVVVGNDVILGDFAFSMDKDSIFTIQSYYEDDEKYFYYVFDGALTELTIGDRVQIGESAFNGAAGLEKVTLGAGATIGRMAFYNNSKLRQIDLSQVLSIGEYAFSGDVYYVCLDDSMAYGAVNRDGQYMYTYHAPVIESVNLAALETMDQYAFAYCRALTEVTLNPNITVLPQYSFAGCALLQKFDMSQITAVEDYAFIECAALETVSLPKAQSIGQYAFVYCHGLTEVTLNPEGTTIGEGAFSYCEVLAKVNNLQAATRIDDYAFAYTALTELDLSGAEHIGKWAFMKEELTPVQVVLGQKLESLGDNPFAMCQVAPFCQTEVKDFNGKEYQTEHYNFQLSPAVQVVDGSLYCQVTNGLELITFAGISLEDAHVAADTVRISAMAFAGSDVQMVTLPVSTVSIGHKAFYLCPALETVVFGSYGAPILEEEFDPAYYESLANIPGTGEFGTYQDYDGQEVTVVGMGLVPYYMWNATDGMYNNVYYGANFVDYIGYVDTKLTMVRPANGQNYDSFIYNQYFDLVINGDKAPDDATLEAIAAIKAIPDRVTYENREIVEQARAIYGKIATLEQQALVSNYADLISAEQRIIALTPTEEEPTEPVEEIPGSKTGWIIAGVAAGVAVIVGVILMLTGKKKKNAPKQEAEAVLDVHQEGDDLSPSTEAPCQDEADQQADTAEDAQ